MVRGVGLVDIPRSEHERRASVYKSYKQSGLAFISEYRKLRFSRWLLLGWVVVVVLLVIALVVFGAPEGRVAPLPVLVLAIASCIFAAAFIVSMIVEVQIYGKSFRLLGWKIFPDESDG